ncbi:uncharacterized protein [Apostichopus japonicus]|uniref:uncharacterized protein isoform X2 n=1 Tax=Stichopus japonicus TaxID=307972 RepID=UPI003AB27710
MERSVSILPLGLPPKELVRDWLMGYTVVASYNPVGNLQQSEQEPVPPMKLRIPRTIASVPASLPDVSITSQDLSNGNDHKANTARSLVVLPARMNIPTEESFNSGKIKEKVVILPGDVESVSNRLEDSEKPEETAAEDNPLNAKYVREAIGEESDGEDAAVIIVGTPGDGEDEGFDAPMHPT